MCLKKLKQNYQRYNSWGLREKKSRLLLGTSEWDVMGDNSTTRLMQKKIVRRGKKTRTKKRKKYSRRSRANKTCPNNLSVAWI
jgi:hypothetical protein